MYLQLIDKKSGERDKASSAQQAIEIHVGQPNYTSHSTESPKLTTCFPFPLGSHTSNKKKTPMAKFLVITNVRLGPDRSQKRPLRDKFLPLHIG